ncbi:TPA: hypothetical protein L4H08_005446 [Pseudomonas aeruginosa]|nr:hypothetical protein [Pseudomonas aeruginosa]
MADKRWTGCTVACIASGPSLTAEDCSVVQASGLPTIAVNTSWKLARFCDVIYAGDSCWWEAYGSEIDIPAERWSCTRQAIQRFGVNHHIVYGEYNSGMRAIQFAIWQGAKRVLLLGYDCSLEHGTHWHGEHGKTKNPDSKKVGQWHRQFGQVSAEAKTAGVEVVNCSRSTALTCFERIGLEEALCSFAE